MKNTLFLALFIAAAFSAAYSQTPKQPPAVETFLMEIEDVFSIAGIGTLANGTIERGKVKVGDEVDIVGTGPTRTTTVVGIIKPPLRERQAEANKGDIVSIILKGITKEDLSRGQLIAKPGSIKAHKKFKVKIDMLSILAGGKKTPMSNGYRPMVMARNGLLPGTVFLPSGTEPIPPGTKGVELEIEVSSPAPLEIGQAIKLREGARVIATGTITGFSDPK